MTPQPDNQALGVTRVRAREEVYVILADALRPPMVERPAAFRGGRWRDALTERWAALRLPPPPGLGSGSPAMLPSLVDYARIFLGPGPAEAPPYESIYRDPSGLVMGEPAVAASAAYREAGLVVSVEPPELPDHIAVELEFMSALCAAEAEARSAGDDEAVAASIGRQAAFLADHLSRWVPAFCARLHATGVAPYPAIAECLATFVASEAEQTTALAAALSEAAA